jgi:hypothetical protein
MAELHIPVLHWIRLGKGLPAEKVEHYVTAHRTNSAEKKAALKRLMQNYNAQREGRAA